MLAWLRPSTEVGRLIAKKRYGKAAVNLRHELQRRPDSVTLRLRLADVLALDDQLEEALDILERLADDLAARGAHDKAIATLRKLRRLAPSWAGVDGKLEALVRERDEKIYGVKRRPKRARGPVSTRKGIETMV